MALKDSGRREEFETGSLRDTRKGKGRFDLLAGASRALTLVACVMEEGAVKYGDRNWEKGQPVGRFLDSALRHLAKYMSGQEDEPHLSQAAWNILCALETLARSDGLGEYVLSPWEKLKLAVFEGDGGGFIPSTHDPSPPKKRRIKRNRARCRECGDTIESVFRHDFRTCGCGAISVDGGLSYIRRLFGKAENIEELSEYEEEGDDDTKLSGSGGTVHTCSPESPIDLTAPLSPGERIARRRKGASKVPPKTR